MNKKTTALLILLAVIVAAASVITVQKRVEAPIPATSSADEYVVDPSDFYQADESTTSMPVGSLTPAEEQWLIHMREEEKLARDVYTTLGEQWGVPVFTNIARSEQTHTDAIKTLLERYGVDDPVNDDTVGAFSLADIKKLYEDLVAQGSTSRSDALVVGATIEDLDIADLDKAMAETSASDINTVYANLQKGSRNHMRAFVKNITAQGGSYTPQYISAEAYQSIISSSQERGRL